jgi:hypothetical protein
MPPTTRHSREAIATRNQNTRGAMAIATRTLLSVLLATPARMA